MGGMMGDQFPIDPAVLIAGIGLPDEDDVEYSNLIVDQYQLIDDEEQERLFREWFVSGDAAEPSWLEKELNEFLPPHRARPPIAAQWTERPDNCPPRTKSGPLPLS